MSGTYDFKKDFARWYKYAHRFHERNLIQKDLYMWTQSFIERKAHRIVAEAAVKRRSILEIGAGGGEHAAFEQSRGLENYIIIDYEKDFLDIARKQFGITAITAQGRELPFKKNSFSTCIATSVFEHVSDLEKMLLEIKRVLEQGGDLLVTVPVNGNLTLQIYKRLVSYPFMLLNGIKKPATVWHYLNVNSFKRIRALLNIHFEIKEQRPVPMKILTTALAPLCFFHCKNDK